MLKTTLRLLAYFVTSPLGISIGMTTLIMGALMGSRLLAEDVPAVPMSQSAFTQERLHRQVQSSRQLLEDIAEVKSETHALMDSADLNASPAVAAIDGYEMMGFADDLSGDLKANIDMDGDLLTPRPDPFAGIAPPRKKSVTQQDIDAILNDDLFIVPSRINAPTDGPSRISQTSTDEVLEEPVRQVQRNNFPWENRS